jgi:lysophospholipase L1-like esterase
MPKPILSSRRAFLSILPTALVTPGLLGALTGDAHANNPFSPDGLTFLFQGDSITDGNRGRNEDPNHIMGHGYAFSIASRLGADFPTRNLKFINKGVSGNTINNLWERWKVDALDLNPNVVSILIGVNDATKELETKDPSVRTDFEKTYRELLTLTREKLPDVLFVLGEPFILPVGKVMENELLWYDTIGARQEVIKRLSLEFNAVFVGYQQIFSDACRNAAASYWIWDGIHPTVPGHELMARTWIKKVNKRLPAIRNE